ncbi:hypothetical protein AB0E67_31610 [Streptomyces sp. NPDC032161]|uniref:hypothetical protein n=1 Tax=unclassified Streptomyces TaxID=2593676 RepID=UPI0033EF4B9B
MATARAATSGQRSGVGAEQRSVDEDPGERGHRDADEGDEGDEDVEQHRLRDH